MQNIGLSNFLAGLAPTWIRGRAGTALLAVYGFTRHAVPVRARVCGRTVGEVEGGAAVRVVVDCSTVGNGCSAASLLCLVGDEHAAASTSTRPATTVLVLIVLLMRDGTALHVTAALAGLAGLGCLVVPLMMRDGDGNLPDGRASRATKPILPTDYTFV